MTLFGNRASKEVIRLNEVIGLTYHNPTGLRFLQEEETPETSVLCFSVCLCLSLSMHATEKKPYADTVGRWLATSQEERLH